MHGGRTIKRVADLSRSAPAPLNESHVLDAFRCTEADLENWLKQRARRSQLEGASRCFVTCDDTAVAGYYALAAGAVLHAQAPGNIRRNMPEPVSDQIACRLSALFVLALACGIGIFD